MIFLYHCEGTFASSFLILTVFSIAVGFAVFAGS